MNLIRRHKGLALVLGLTLILVIIIFIIFSNMIFTSGDSVYGNRLEGIAKVDKNALNSIVDAVEELEEVEKAEIRIQGKIIYTTITYVDGADLDDAKDIASNTLGSYKEDVLDDYDFGFFLKENVVDDEETEEKEAGFIVAGTKHPENESISWTN